MDSGRTTGGILRLLELYEAHPAEFAYDFRSRFHTSVYTIGTEIGWTEAILIVSVLTREADSWLGTQRAGWKHPASREWMVLTHLYDLLAAVNSGKKKPKPYPKPYKENTNRLGSGKPQNRSDVLKNLERMNPKETDGK